MKGGSFLSGILGGLVLAALVGFFVLPMLGIFDITATGKPNILDWWGNTNLHNTLSRDAPKTKIPATADPSKGFDHYMSTCLHCHGGPDAPRETWANNMLPMPPDLQQEHTMHMSDGELLYVIGNGIRMSGMPAFGPDHSDEDIWNIVAIVRGLGKLTDAQRQQLQRAAGFFWQGGGGHGGGSEGGHHTQ